MTDREALVAAVASNREEDTPRLALADWLDEHDEPERAAAIRAGIAAGGTVPRAPEEVSTIAAEGHPLQPELARLAALGATSAVVNRGFAEGIVIPWPRWIGAAPALRAEFPIWVVGFGGWPHYFGRDGAGQWQDTDDPRFYWRDRAECAADLKARWPGIVFKLPGGDPDGPPPITMTFRINAFGTLGALWHARGAVNAAPWRGHAARTLLLIELRDTAYPPTHGWYGTSVEFVPSRPGEEHPDTLPAADFGTLFHFTELVESPAP